MKTRSGFVSNSSSSSFVVERFTTAQIARIMLWEVMSRWAEYDPDDIPYMVKDALDWLNSNIDYDDPLFFPWSTNEETFIWRENPVDSMVVTCNNNDWSLLSPRYCTVDRPYDLEFFRLDTMQKAKGDWRAFK